MSKSRVTKRPRHEAIQSSLQPPADASSKPDPVTPTGTVIPDHMPDSTPISYKVSGTDAHSSHFYYQHKHNIQLEDETRGKWVGPMDPAVFIGRYQPPVTSNVVRPDFGKKTFAEVARATDEVAMYSPFIDAITPFAPHLKLVDTHSKVDTDCDGIAVDVSVYRLNANGECAIEKNDFSQMEIPVEFKHKNAMDPFVDLDEKPEATKEHPYPFERDDNADCKVIRGQIAAYASALSGAQFRLHFFSVLVIGEWARLLRWDRDGVIVTRRFSYKQDDTLVEFFWRYSHAPLYDPSGPSRGHDHSVTSLPPSHRPTPKQTTAQIQLQGANRTVNDKNHHREFRVMMIPDRTTGEEFPFLFSYPPRYVRLSPFGRSTRPMLAFDLKKEILVFVKDYWRSVGDNLEKEGDIYKILEDKKVPYIAPFGKGNDIRNHITHTHTVKSEDWAYPTANMVSLHQYRMSLEEVGRPLNEFVSSHELVTAVADAMEGHECAFHVADILHRDISAGNILVTNSGRGMLIDWDLCLMSGNLQHKARRPDRTGTWQFMSVYLLMGSGRTQGVMDDRESSLYVVLWNMLRHTRHNMMDEMADRMDLFDQVSRTGKKGGYFKRDFLANDHKDFHFENRPHLNNLIRELSRTFSARYETYEEEDLEYYRKPENADMPSNYYARMAKLQSRGWLVATMRKHLALEGWPTDDRAVLNPMIGDGTLKQIERQQAILARRAVGPTHHKRTQAN